MQKMIMFRLNRECREIAVNPARVLYVSQYEHGASSLHFGKDCFVRVQGDMEDVVRRIETALCSDVTAMGTAPARGADTAVN